MMINNTLTFDIETIPDTKAGKILYGIDATDERIIAKKMYEHRAQQGDTSGFLPLHLHRIVAISVVLKIPKNIKIWSLGDIHTDEKDIIERFFLGIEKYTPTLVSWNGTGFDLPVLHYRSLIHGIAAPKYWELGETDNTFKWNNYLNRYHYRHIDIMDIIACYQPRAFAKLDEIAVLLGLPGKMGMSGNKVWDNYLDGHLEGIRNYCETDVLNTYLIYLRFLLIQGKIQKTDYEILCQEIREYLTRENKTHFSEFLAAWTETTY
jgi:predicted PolB exonuclease-like 3'-5' exonuclease